MISIAGCGHCTQFAPVFDDIAIEIRDKVLAGKINCERFQQLCRQLGIRAYPTIRFYPGNTGRGEEIHSRNPQEILDIIEARLEQKAAKIAHDEL